MNKPDFSHYIINTKELFDSLVRYESEIDSDLVSFDLECDSEIEKKANIYGIGLCFSDKKAFYIPWRYKTGAMVWESEQADVIVSWLRNCLTSRKIIGHNLVYDALVVENNFGIRIDEYIYSDTILMKHTLDEEPPFALKEIAPVELGSWATKAQEKLAENVKANGGKWTEDQKDMYLADTDILGEYCCWDVLLTLMLFNVFNEKLKNEKLTKLFYEDEVMPLYKEVTINMKRKGFTIDVPHFEKLKVDLESEIKLLENAIYDSINSEIQHFETSVLDKDYPTTGTLFPKTYAEIANIPLPINKKTGKITLSSKAIELQKQQNPEYSSLYDHILDIQPRTPLNSELVEKTQRYLFFRDNPEKTRIFNLSSAPHMGHLLYNCLGIQPFKFTKAGKPSTDKEVLDELIEQYSDTQPWMKKLNDYRKLGKLLSTYVNGILDRRIEGAIYASMLQFGTTSGRFSSRNPNCLSLDTEILTKNGWKKYNEIAIGDEVAAYNGKKLELQKVTKHYISESDLKDIVTVKNRHIDMRMTSNHRVIYFDRHSNFKQMEKFAENFPKDAAIYHGVYTESKNIGINLDWLRFLVACQADGELRKDHNNIGFIFRKERKYRRLKNILSRLNYNVVDKSTIDSNGMKYEIVIKDCRDDVVNILGYQKEFPHNWIFMGTKERQILIEELFYWDGSFTRKNNYSSNSEKNVDFVQALCSLEGWRAHKRIYFSKQSKFPNYQIDITRRNYSLTANCNIKISESTERVWCVQVKSGMFLARRGSDTFITGNCQNLPRIKDEESNISELVLKYTNSIKKGFISPKGYKIVNADYASLEPMCVHEDSLVQTKEGFKKIKDVKINEEILTKDGYKNVLNKWNSNKKTLEIVSKKGILRCSPDHKIFVKGMGFIEAKNINLGDELEHIHYSDTYSSNNLPLYFKDSIIGSKPLGSLTVDTDLAWLLGAYLGDGVGCLAKKHKYIGVCGLEQDGVLSKFKRILNEYGLSSCSVEDKRTPGMKTIKYHDAWLTSIFHNTFDVIAEKKKLRVPIYIYNMTPAIKMAFVAGLIDTDGTFNKKKSELKISSKSAEFLTDINSLLSTFKISGKLNTAHKKLNDKQLRVYELRFTAKDLKLFSALGLERYQTVARKIITPPKRIGKTNEKALVLEINKLPDSNMVDISVEQNNEFICNGLRVHNCFAHMSGDEKLRNVFKNGEDLYSRVGIETFGVTDASANKKDATYLKNLYPEIRQTSKGIALAIPYGAQAAQISRLTNKSYKEGQEIINNYLKNFPNLHKYMKTCDYTAKTQGMVKTELGRIRHLKEVKSIYLLFGDRVLDRKWAKANGHIDTRARYKNLLNNAKNFPIQGLAAHIVNRAMLAVSRAFKQANIDAWVALQVHDEITCIAREDQAEKAAELLKICMEETTKISVPLSAEPVIADNLAEAK